MHLVKNAREHTLQLLWRKFRVQQQPLYLLSHLLSPFRRPPTKLRLLHLQKLPLVRAHKPPRLAIQALSRSLVPKILLRMRRCHHPPLGLKQDLVRDHRQRQQLNPKGQQQHLLPHQDLALQNMRATYHPLSQDLLLQTMRANPSLQVRRVFHRLPTLSRQTAVLRRCQGQVRRLLCHHHLNLCRLPT